MLPSVVHCAWQARAVLGQQLSGEGQQSVPVWETTPVGRPARPHLPIGLGWSRLEAALSLIWRWRGALEGELAEGKPQGGWFPHR